MARAPVTPLLYNLVMKIIFEGPGTRVGIVEHELKAHGIEVRYERPEERRGIEPIEAVHILLEVVQHLTPEELNDIVNTVRAKLSVQLPKIKFWVED